VHCLIKPCYLEILIPGNPAVIQYTFYCSD